jgi:hypothetical protein
MADDPNAERPPGGRSSPVGPLDPLVVPRFAGPATFARLPRREDVGVCDVAVHGIPFDSGVTYRPGARFGPQAVRNGSRLLRSYHPARDVKPFAVQQVVDAGDVADVDVLAARESGEGRGPREARNDERVHRSHRRGAPTRRSIGVRVVGHRGQMLSAGAAARARPIGQSHEEENGKKERP